MPVARSFPGNDFVLTSTRPSRPFTGMRTMAPSRLMSSASAGRQTSVTSWPASASFMPSNEPYEAPRISIFRIVSSSARSSRRAYADIVAPGDRRVIYCGK